ncbi:MAG: hypothetical protein KF768_14215 [Phycisphaeraceae bacterium]|nr:hypothetical protein [Phycisphaeraceae bacterium]
MSSIQRFFALVASILLAGCATYRTPGGPVSIPGITDSGIAEALARKPAATFPVRLIVTRVQASGYESYSNRGVGTGRYSVVTTRDVETEADIARLGKMPGVAAIGALKRLLLPGNLTSAMDLRAGAAQLHGDILLLYTFDTSFRTDTTRIGPLQLVSLGFFPNKKAVVTSTCSAAFIDVRTGYLYGVAEATAKEAQRSDLWSTREALEAARLRACAPSAARSVRCSASWRDPGRRSSPSTLGRTFLWAMSGRDD